VPRTGTQRFFALLGIAGFVSAAWLLVPFSIGLALIVFEDSSILSLGSDRTLWELLFFAAWIIGFIGAVTVPSLTAFAGLRIKTPGRAIPLAVILSVIAYAALSWLAIVGLDEIYFTNFSLGPD